MRDRSDCVNVIFVEPKFCNSRAYKEVVGVGGTS